MISICWRRVAFISVRACRCSVAFCFHLPKYRSFHSFQFVSSSTAHTHTHSIRCVSHCFYCCNSIIDIICLTLPLFLRVFFLSLSLPISVFVLICSFRDRVSSRKSLISIRMQFDKMSVSEREREREKEWMKMCIWEKGKEKKKSD